MDPGSTVDSILISNLRQAVSECSDRGLLTASKWYVPLPTDNCPLKSEMRFRPLTRASDLLLSIPSAKRDICLQLSSQHAFSTSTPARDHSSHKLHLFGEQSLGVTQSILPMPATPVRHPHLPPSLDVFEPLSRAMIHSEEQDLLNSARRYMELREYHRVVSLLKNCTSPKGKFMRLYCQFLVSLMSRVS